MFCVSFIGTHEGPGFATQTWQSPSPLSFSHNSVGYVKVACGCDFRSLLDTSYKLCGLSALKKIWFEEESDWNQIRTISVAGVASFANAKPFEDSLNVLTWPTQIKLECFLFFFFDKSAAGMEISSSEPWTLCTRQLSFSPTPVQQDGMCVSLMFFLQKICTRATDFFFLFFLAQPLEFPPTCASPCLRSLPVGWFICSGWNYQTHCQDTRSWMEAAGEGCLLMWSLWNVVVTCCGREKQICWVCCFTQPVLILYWL